MQPDRASALRLADLFIEEYQEQYPEVIEVLSEGLEDSLQFYSFENFDLRKVSSTNIQERLHKERSDDAPVLLAYSPVRNRMYGL
ncbi:MAG: transposase [Spirochaetota bacterium]|nr:MAG: transposase [Spirochaetota bacterium]